MHDGFFKLLEALSGDLLSLIVCHSVVVVRFLFDRSVAVVHEVHGDARDFRVGVREEVTFGPESRFGEVCHGLVEHGLEDGHGERKPIALQLREDILRDADHDVLARLLVGVVIERLLAVGHDVAHERLLGCAIR